MVGAASLIMRNFSPISDRNIAMRVEMNSFNSSFRSFITSGTVFVCPLLTVGPPNSKSNAGDERNDGAAANHMQRPLGLPVARIGEASVAPLHCSRSIRQAVRRRRSFNRQLVRRLKSYV